MAKKAVGHLTAKRKRARKETKGKKQGKPSWIEGEKLAFMERYKQEWLDAGDDPGAFYTTQTKRFLLKTGWDPRFAERGCDFDAGVPDPTEQELKDFVSPTEDVEEKTKYFQVLRTKIGQWYRYHYKKILAEESLEASVESLLAGFGPEKPTKKRILHRYSRNHYDSRIRPAFEAEMALLEQKFKDGELPTKPHEVAVRNRITQTQWGLEDDAFRQRIELEVEEEHKAEMAEYDAAVEAADDDADSRTPQEFQKLLSTAAATLDPLSEALSRRYGMAVSILLAGPIPNKGGAIKVLSSNAGRTRGRGPKSWPQADPGGFTGVVLSMSRFATLMFSQEECDARALGGAHRLPPAQGGSGAGIFNGLLRMDDEEPEAIHSSSSEEEDEEEEDEEEEEEEEEEEPLAVVVEKGKKGKKAKAKAKEKVAKKTGEKAKEKAKSAPKTRGKENGGKGKKVASPAKTTPTKTTQRPKPKPAFKGPALPPPPPPPVTNDGGDGAAVPPPPPPPPVTNDGGDGAAVPPPPPPPPPATNDGGDGDRGVVPEVEGDREKDMETPQAPPAPWPLIGARWSPELRRVYPWWEAEAARFGDGWEECVWAFVCFEEASVFPAERVRMPVTPARNKVGIDSWINLGRSITATPEQYGKWFWAWWRGMQLEARLIEDGVLSRASNIVWDDIRDLSGKNGLLQVIMVLMWWGIKAHSDDASAEAAMDWQLGMEDVRWALDEMVKEGKLSKKRAAERGLLEKKNGPALKKKR
ncbi:hypothetical protein DFH06DRAFT_1151375 [Mycena polygramma]|nr:hypothetical protein DFH06DRAFT_1151375 [Mycena polygramma]